MTTWPDSVSNRYGAELLVDLGGRLEDVLEDVDRRQLRVELGQVGAELVADAVQLVAGDAARDLEHLLAVGERAAVVELGAPRRPGRRASTPCGRRLNFSSSSLIGSGCAAR